MIIIQIVGLALLSAILIIVIKQVKPELAFLLSIAAGLVILILIMRQVEAVIELINQLARQARIDMIYFNTIIKIIGIAYIGEFGAELTRDSGEGALASKIELATKIIIMVIAIPIMLSLIETILRLIPA
ncbi:MAG TPA: stage III sporulation protein AD [Halanaerobiaceae bacterium]|jgi:stage III sporulation protein AD|nr:stage III sporulation protein AD [Bacillota bacterium]HHU92876.1 stage III sporulation protein AD [Halanaerobiaceae bacterium]HOA41314.1 stage III sporulation protein AD [Halanaerobiales bacterium]HPZ63498.1 stage III sporulation protein AD [Halanaerobiales bacterium]HQD03961.1 stage III sporulation protein AD [Halanaerobiales bacterium]